MSATPPSRPRPALAVVTVLMCALAAGAVWCVLVLKVHRATDPVALAVAALLAVVVRNHGYAGRPFGAVLAAGATALAIVYARCLIATAEIAQTMGMSLRDALARIGPDFAFALARSNLERGAALCYGLALVLAVWIVLRPGRG